MDSLERLAEDLTVRDPVCLWGVSPRSISLSLAARIDGCPLTRGLRPSYRASILRTNDKRTMTEYARAHEVLLADLGLVEDDGLTDLGRLLAMVDEPGNVVRAIAARELQGLSALLRELSALDDTRLKRSELESLTRNTYEERVLVPLLTSLGFATVGPRIVSIERELIDAVSLTGGADTPKSGIVYHLVSATTGVHEKPLCAEIASRVHKGGNIPEEVPSLETTIAGLAGTEHETIPLESIESAVDETIAVLKDERSKVFDLFTQRESPATTDSRLSLEDVIDSTSLDRARSRLLLSFLATCRSRGYRRAALKYVADLVDGNGYEAFNVLDSLRGIECRIITDGVIEFESIPSIDIDPTSDYETFLGDRLGSISRQVEILRSVEVRVRAPHRDRIAVSCLGSLQEGVVEPTYFAYTLPDPKALGDERMDRYVGGSDGLREERAKLRQWGQRRPPDTRRFRELTDRLVTIGQRDELEERILRIMTPYDDDTFSEYASQFRSLLDSGFEIRLLTRHTREKWQWERLRDNLLGELDRNRENVSIRTYSRYKEYRQILNEEDEQEMNEFGIHAKLQTIGHAEEGAALLGSANFMENSYDWNPECGAYTENSRFVATAIDFFDHVWDLAGADEVDLDRLQKIPNRRFFPSYYTP